MEQRVEELYFLWLVNLIDDGDSEDYSEVLGYLYRKEFIWSISFDSNRAAYGLDLRDRFIFDNDYGDLMKRYMNDGPCSVLEMMVALSLSCETVAGNAVDWFWFMIKNLGLKDYRNGTFDLKNLERKVDIFLDRKFRPDGKGGLFYIRNSKNDLTKIEIWSQFMYYVNSTGEFDQI